MSLELWEHVEFESLAAFPDTFDSVYLCSFCGADAGFVQALSLYHESTPVSDARYRAAGGFHHSAAECLIRVCAVAKYGRLCHLHSDRDHVRACEMEWAQGLYDYGSGDTRRLLERDVTSASLGEKW